MTATRLTISKDRKKVKISVIFYSRANLQHNSQLHLQHQRSPQIATSTRTFNMETVLVVGATGNIGVAAILAALRSNRNVLAIVRNQASAAKLFQHVGTQEGITIVEANIMSEHGVQSVVDKVRAGKLPAFQHVYAAGEYPPSSA